MPPRGRPRSPGSTSGSWSEGLDAEGQPDEHEERLRCDVARRLVVEGAQRREGVPVAETGEVGGELERHDAGDHDRPGDEGPKTSLLGSVVTLAGGLEVPAPSQARTHERSNWHEADGHGQVRTGSEWPCHGDPPRIRARQQEASNCDGDVAGAYSFDSCAGVEPRKDRKRSCALCSSLIAS